VSAFDASAKNTAKPHSVRRRVDRKILRFSLSIGAAAAFLAGFLYIASAYPSVRRWKGNNLRGLAEISCAAETCDTSQFTTDWQLDEPDYVIDTQTLYLVTFPALTDEVPEQFPALEHLDIAFIRRFREPTSYATPDGEVWRLYSRGARVAEKNVEIFIGYAVKAPWKMVETLQSQIGTVDAKLKIEVDKIAANLPTQNASARGPRLRLSADGFVIVDPNTGRVEMWAPWLPTFLRKGTRLPAPGYQLYVHESNFRLYLIDSDTSGRLLAVSSVDIGSLWWLAALCGIAFLSMSVLARALSRRYLRRCGGNLIMRSFLWESG
jgi:hypothetical protein